MRRLWLPAPLVGAAAVLLGFCSASSHSLRYFYTAVSEPGQGLPWFIAVGYVDDQLIDHYDSNTRRDLPQVPWMEKAGEEEPQYWDKQTRVSQNSEQWFRGSLGNVRKYYNQSGGFHSLQRMYSCELRGDGSRGGYFQYGYDGRNYLSLDKETLTWTAADATSQRSKRKLEVEMANAQYWKAYLEGTCIESLQKYLGYGKEALLRKEKPMVKVTRKADYDGMETLLCRAHGFYPKEIDVVWTRDGEVWTQDTFHGVVAPNSDGTYHTWIGIRIDPQDRDRYRCRVGHDSMLDPLDFAWEDSGASNLGIIIGCAVGFLVLLAAVIGGVCLYRKHQDGYKAASTKMPGSLDEGYGCSPLPVDAEILTPP